MQVAHRLAAAAVLTTACLVCTVALGAGSPGFRLEKAPGLARNVDADGTTHVPHTTGASPTLARCTSAWNGHAPAVTRRWLAAFAPRPASAWVGSSRGWRYCVVYVSLDERRMLAAYLYGTDVWKGIVVSPPIAAVPQFTGSLLHDGSVRAG
jgi:hypothetical protein